MQIAAMNPASVDKEDVDQTIIDRELEIAREQIRAEGKPEAMLDKIAQGKLNKFFKENTLLNQEFRSEEHTSELQSLMRISYAVFCLKKKNMHLKQTKHTHNT